MKKILLLLIMSSIFLGACGSGSYEGNWESENYIFKIYDNRYVVFDKEDKTEPISTVQFKEVKDSKLSGKTTIDEIDEDGETISRDKFYVFDDELTIYFGNDGGSTELIRLDNDVADEYKEKESESSSGGNLTGILATVVCISAFIGIAKYVRREK